QLNSDRRVMLFDLALGGHHGGYIQHLIDYWCDRDLTGSLDIVVLPQFLEIHSDTIDAALKHQNPKINFIPIAPEEVPDLNTRNSFIRRSVRNFQEWQLFCKYARALKATDGLLMYFDTYEMPLAIGMPSPCPFSGIYFRPTFHYNHFADYVPSRKDSLQQWREKFAMSRILRHPQLQNLFCLDPFVSKYLEQFRGTARAVYLPDPVQLYDTYKIQPKQLKNKLGIDSNRLVFLLFGAIDRRKGIYQLLEALGNLPAQLASQLCLLLVGPLGADEKDREKMQNIITQLHQSLPIQIVIENRFVADREIEPYFQLADVILAPYQRHVGMSAILVRAAFAQTPVLSSDYGLMGEITRRYQLGITVDATAPKEITKRLTQLLLKSPAAFGDREQMKYFAEQNKSEKYTSIIFKNILSRSSCHQF
ncbi:MAG: glycosyltransferase, partial [Xenococcaceae cyanobacterium]